MTTTTSKDIPYDVVLDILSRLAVKTLIRFRCVCKPWYAAIALPSFITTHLNRASSSHTDKFLELFIIAPFPFPFPFPFLKREDYFEPTLTLRLLSDEPYVEKSEISFSCESHCTLVGSVNGIFCLYIHSNLGHHIYLWNPSIRNCKILPVPTLAHHHSAHYSFYAVFGFGFHHQTNDYKVLSIVHDDYRRYPEVYTLSTDSWRKIVEDVPSFVAEGTSNTIFSGSVHWVASSVPNEPSDMIMSFDIGDETFRGMKLPNYFIDQVGSADLGLGVLKDSLSLCVYHSQQSGLCDIWVMREFGVVDSWTKQFAIVVPQGRVCKFLGFNQNNELLLLMMNGELISVDLESPLFKCRRIPEIKPTMNVVPFTETLVLLEGANAGNARLGQ